MIINLKKEDKDVIVEPLTATENGVYTAPKGKAYSPVTVEVGEPYPPIIKRVTGNPISFSDGADAPMIECKATIEAQQDLHGYSKPWVGGAGKNKINAPDVTLADAGDVYNGSISLAAGTWTLSSSNTSVSVTVEGVTGTMPLTFTLAAAITTIQITASGAGTFNNIQIESGSTATAYESYSNICPITGMDEVNIDVAEDDQSTPIEYTIDLNGTRYGGTVDAVRGVMSVTWGMVTLNAFNLKNAEMRGIRLNNTLPNVKAGFGKLICNMFVRASSYYEAVGDLKNSIGYNASGVLLLNVYANDNYITDINTINAMIPADGCQICYECEPFEIPLTPTSLRTLSGNNYIWTDADSMTIDYITDAYQNFVNTVESALPNTRKGGTTAMDIFQSLEVNDEEEKEVTDEIKEEPTEEVKK